MNRRSFLFSGLGSLAALAMNDHAALSQTELGVGVIFVGASWCPACKSAAPVLSAVTAPLNIPVLVASHDARPIAPFPDFIDAQQHAFARQINRFPHTLIYASGTDRIEGEIFGYKNAADYAGRLRRALIRSSGGTS